MQNSFSINSITQKLGLLAKRFPISILLLVCLSCLIYYIANYIRGNISYENINYKWYIFLSLGFVISVVATLWLENFVNYIKQHLITAAIVLLWGVYCFFLPIKEDDKFFIEKGIELAGIGIFVFLSFFFISFLKKDNNNAFWNFAVKTIFHFHLAVLFGSIIFIGLVAASFAVKNLFDIADIPEIIYINLAIIIYGLFVPIYFLANIPDKISKKSEEILFELNKYSKILALYILAPLAVIYAIILYVYLVQIIVALELPKGLVSYLVSSLACSSLFIISLLHPSRIEEENKLIAFVSRYFGLIMLPLLALMSIGIIRRIDDYGITISRLYILLINVWYYGIFIYLFITKAKKIKPIFISFAVIILLSSISFCGIPKITKTILTYELNGYLSNQKISLSDISSYYKIELKNKEKIKDKIVYLDMTCGKECVQPFFIDSVNSDNFGRFENHFLKEKAEIEEEIKREKEREKEEAERKKREKAERIEKEVERIKREKREAERKEMEKTERIKKETERIIKEIKKSKMNENENTGEDLEWIGKREREIGKIEREKKGSEKINGSFFYADGMIDNETHSIGNFNNFVYLSNYRDYRNDGNIYSQNNELIIKILGTKNYSYKDSKEVFSRDYIVFSIPLKKLAQDLLEKKELQLEDKIFKYGDYKILHSNHAISDTNYTILINSIYGFYYEAADSILISSFTGYLFYNK